MQKRYHTLENIIFDAIVYLVMAFVLICCLVPFIYMLAVSFSGTKPLINGEVFLWPKDFTLDSYKQIFTYPNFFKAYGNTFLYAVGGTAIALIMTSLMAYPLSKTFLWGNKFFTKMVVVTMFFSGGMVPDYLLIRDLDLINSIWSLILPGAISAYNITIMRNYLMSLPDSLEESAYIDGANDIVILYKIIVPLSLPILATIALWTAVGHWNAWFDAMIYIQDTDKQVLAITLRRIVLQGSNSVVTMSGEEMSTQTTSDTIKAATIMVATVPILCVYPFIQKYFEKGVMIGAVKG